MGIYWAALNEFRKEILYPPDGNADKYPGICHQENVFPQLLVYLMKCRWLGEDVCLVNDMGDEYYDKRYTDITKEVEKEYRELWEDVAD